MSNKSSKWPSFASFVLNWIAMSLLTWVLACLLALVFMRDILSAGLVPDVILLPLALLPILLITLVVQTVLLMVGRSIHPEGTVSHKRLVFFGTPVITWICLLVIIWFMGGPDAFVPRL